MIVWMFFLAGLAMLYMLYFSVFPPDSLAVISLLRVKYPQFSRTVAVYPQIFLIHVGFFMAQWTWVRKMEVMGLTHSRSGEV